MPKIMLAITIDKCSGQRTKPWANQSSERMTRLRSDSPQNWFGFPRIGRFGAMRWCWIQGIWAILRNCEIVKMAFASLASLFLLLSITAHPSVQDRGTTPRIKEIVVGRCYDYQYKKIGLNSTTWKNCSKIWDTFHGAFAYKNPCKLTFDDYKPYFEEVGMAEIYNKVRTDFANLLRGN